MPTAVLVYDDTPPSSNKNNGIGGRGHPKAVARTKRDWQGIFGMLLMKEGVPRGIAKATATARLEFVRAGARRDSDNFYFPLAKPLGDALFRGGWLVDDDSERYHFERVEISLEKLTGVGPLVKGRTTVTLEYEMP